MSKAKKVILLLKPEGIYDRRLLQGIAKYIHSHQNWSLFYKTEQDKRALYYVRNWGAHGIIADYREADKFSQAFPEIPLITVGANKLNSAIPNVSTDANAIAQMAFDHFNERGFKNFAFCGYDDLKWSLDRKLAFEAILREKNLPCFCFISKYQRNRRSWEKELNLLIKWLVSLPKPSAILACNDEYGRRLLESCKITNIYLPEEVAVVGVDGDDIICNLCTPTLSSVFIDSELAGYKTAELLDRLMEGEQVNGQTVVAEPTEVQIRGSSDIYLINDPEVNRLIKYINQNANRFIDMEELAHHACKSRRSLYNSFINATGQSASQYIRAIRIKQISKLLLNTDLSLDRIAWQLGYSGPEKISRIFKKEKGITPSQYRKKFRGNR